LEQLITPEMNKNDAVLPGENWFFYWKTSPSLWEDKFKQYQGVSPIFVPIYWALHSEFSDYFDFGHKKPETDLKRLLECAKSQGKELVFLLPTSPMPFVSNGGVPSYLARTSAKNKEKMAITVLDNEKKVNKIYSYYDPRVFQAFRKFTRQLGEYFSQLGIEAPVFGLDCMRIEDGHVVSFFKDHSQTFENGYNRYLKQLQADRADEDPTLELEAGDNLKLDYFEMIQNLYLNTGEEFLAGCWGGVVKTCFLGGGNFEIFNRCNDLWESEQDYFHPLFTSIVNEIYPTTILLNHKLTQGPLGKAMRDIADTSLVQVQVADDLYSDEQTLSFLPLVFFEIYDNGKGFFSCENAITESGLKYFFDREYPWLYKIKNEFNLLPEDAAERSIYFFFGERLNLASFHTVLKLFMHGHKIFLDIAKLDKNLVKKLEVFYAENNLNVEKIHYITEVAKTSLGEGLLVTYNSEKLKTTSLLKRVGFWETMLGYLDLKHLKVSADDQLYHFWKARSSNLYELNYEEVRRVSFYNPTSYKKKAHLNSSSNFAFIKTVDQVNVEVSSTPIGIDINMLPRSSVTLDFGFYE
jgi:hypothetical protein